MYFKKNKKDGWRRKNSSWRYRTIGLSKDKIIIEEPEESEDVE